MTLPDGPTPRTDAAMWGGYDGPVVVDVEFARTLEREIQQLQQALKAERDSFIQLAVRTLGQEGYDNSPYQAHPGELVEAEIERLRDVLHEIAEVWAGSERCERGDCACAREDAREAAQMIRHLRGTIAADDARMLAAGTRVGILVGCDTPEWMADEIERLRADLATCEAALESLQNKWASRPLSVEDTAELERENDRLRADLESCRRELQAVKEQKP